MSVGYKIIVKGKVQGVWFRKFTRQKAESLALTGYVQNRPNGNVYIEVRGEEAALSDFIEWLHRGSPLSKVREVLVEKTAPGSFTGFEIRY